MRGYVKAVEKASFNVEKGEGVGLAGESGCGKTTVALSILRLLPPNGKIMHGQILYKGKDLVKMDEKTLRKKIRWKEISLIFQGAMNALNPVYKISDQIIEAIRTHEPNINKREAKERVKKLFELVGIDPSRIDNYPHEFSGGMRQRAMIAMALACNPSLVIADEPGTALDVIVQAQVLKLMRDLKEKLNLSLILITHDLSIISEVCEKMVVMYAGQVVEAGDIITMFKKPLHPYTQGLIRAFPSIKEKKRKMSSIPGMPPDLLNPPSGCRFRLRCKYAMDICEREAPQLIEVSKGHVVACHLVGGKK
ncbi:ABC transporter ATP-binding protein [Candidatus Bathyarchaeota archaeon]|nr:ABC transporter ATP-binding protein [Candidatus Bathyarchaeota archaeon]